MADEKMKKKIITRNQKSLKDLILSEQASLNTMKNKAGALFFTCGNVKGYVAKKLAAQIATVAVDEVQYAEVFSEEKKQWIPCLMMAGTGAPVVRTFSLDDLQK